MLGRSSEELVAKALQNPTIEDSGHVEFKALEKVADNEGRRDVAKILSAFVNTNGGVLIVGVGLDTRGARVQSFPENTTAVQDLVSMVHGNTQPSAASYMQGTMQVLKRFQCRIMRFDVRRASEIIGFKNPKTGDYEAWHRVHGMTLKMAPSEVAARARQNSDNSGTPLAKWIRLEVDTSRDRPTRPLPLPKHRIVMRVEENIHWSFGPRAAPDTFNRSHFYALRSSFPCDSIEAVARIVRHAHEHVGVRLDDDFCYSIKERTVQLFGSIVTRINSQAL